MSLRKSFRSLSGPGGIAGWYSRCYTGRYQSGKIVSAGGIISRDFWHWYAQGEESGRGSVPARWPSQWRLFHSWQWFSWKDLRLERYWLVGRPNEYALLSELPMFCIWKRVLACIRSLQWWIKIARYPPTLILQRLNSGCRVSAVSRPLICRLKNAVRTSRRVGQFHHHIFYSPSCTWSRVIWTQSVLYG